MSYPYIYAEMMKVVNHRYISGEQIVTCLGVVLFGILWNKKGDILYKHYLKIVTLEIFADTFLFVHVLLTGDLKFYFVLNILIYAFITRNMANGGIRLRAKVHPDEKSREHYDNNCNIMDSIALVFGYFCIGYVIGSIIYWLYKLYEYIVFRVNYTVFTSYYVYRIRKNKTWHDSLLTYATEQYIIERRKRYHIFDKYVVSRIYKELLQLHHKMTAQLKNGQRV